MFSFKILTTIFVVFILGLQTPLVHAQDPNSAQCVEYAKVANLSTIGANSTYRAAFLQSSKLGTLGNKLMLDAAVAKIPSLQNNADLNNQCGNLTAIAISAAETNFTQGIVAQFSGIKGNPQAIVSGPIIPVCVILILLVQFLIFFFAP